MTAAARSSGSADFIAQSIEAARAVEKPFFHLEFDRVFPTTSTRRFWR